MAEAVISTHKSEVGMPCFVKCLSDDKKMAVFQVGQQDDGVNMLWDLQAGTFKEVTRKGMSDYPVFEVDIHGVNDISNNGILVGCLNAYPAYYQNGKWTVFDADKAEGDINAITPDGSVMVGWISIGEQLFTNPIVWTLDEKTNKYVADTLEWNSSMNELIINGAMATGISADGKRIVGTLQDDKAIWPAVLWVYNEETKKYDVDFFTAQYIDFEDLKADDDHEYISVFSAKAFISPNGKYVSGSESVNESHEFDWVAGRYEVDTKTLKVFGDDAKNPVPMQITAVADDGTLVGWHQDAPGMVGRIGRIVLPTDEVPTNIMEYYKKNNVKKLFDLDSLTHAVFAVSPDARMFLGMYMNERADVAAYCVDFDGAIETAVENVVVQNQEFCTMVGNNLHLNQEVSNLYIISVSGQVVYTTNAPGNVVNLDHLASGVYVALALQNDKLISTKIVIL